MLSVIPLFTISCVVAVAVVAVAVGGGLWMVRLSFDTLMETVCDVGGDSGTGEGERGQDEMGEGERGDGEIGERGDGEMRAAMAVEYNTGTCTVVLVEERTEDESG